MLDVRRRFYLDTGMIAIQHTNGFVARYCEVEPESVEDWRQGMRVQGGQVIAKVGQLLRSSMLHFELYSGRGSGDLTDRRKQPFQRRSDLLNPTAFLDSLKRDLLTTRSPVILPDAAAQSIG